MMEKSILKEKIIKVLKKLFSNWEEDADIFEYVDLIDDLGMDSINFISLIIQLEAEFEIQIPDDWLLMERFRACDLISLAVEELIMQKEAGVFNCE